MAFQIAQERHLLAGIAGHFDKFVEIDSDEVWIAAVVERRDRSARIVFPPLPI